MSSRHWLEDYFGPAFLKFMGVELPERKTVIFEGAVEVDDSEVENATIVRVPGTSLVGDDDGVAEITATEVVATGEETLRIRSLLGHVTTTDDTPATVTLLTLADLEVWDARGVVTVRNADATVRGSWSLRELAYRAGGGATLQDAVGEDPGALKSDAGLEALFVVSGNTLRLQVTGLPEADPIETLTWGYEVRLQKQMEEPAP